MPLILRAFCTFGLLLCWFYQPLYAVEFSAEDVIYQQDENGDGRLDYIVTPPVRWVMIGVGEIDTPIPGAQPYSVLLQQADGSYVLQQREDFTVLPNGVTPLTGLSRTYKDFNGDGINDFFLRTTSTTGVLSYSSAGVSSSAKLDFSAYTQGGNVVLSVSDANGDGINDLVMTEDDVILAVAYGARNNTLNQLNYVVPEHNPGNMVVNLSGQLDVSDLGAATYTLPIDLPPGINGMQGSVSVSYSSMSGNGPMGLGWNLAAGGSITRCGMTFEQDGLHDGVDFDDNDKFCLDGQRLHMQNLGSYAQAGFPMRTEVESFQRIVPNGSYNGDPADFTVTQPDGMVRIYGGDNSKRIVNSNGRVVSYLLSEVRDVNGNSVIYVYTSQHSEGVPQLSQIQYNGYTLQVQFENRNDVIRGYLAPSTPYAYTKRISRLDISYQNRALYNYVFNYQEVEPRLQNSRLTSIQRCLPGLAKCTLPLLFSYESEAGQLGGFDLAYEATPLPTEKYNSYFHKYKSGDFNGDGLMDVANISLYYLKVWFSNGNGSFSVKDRFPSTNSIILSGPSYIDGHSYDFYPGDFDGDGDTDLTYIMNASSIQVWLSNGDGTFEIKTFTPAGGVNVGSAKYKFQIGEFNGDGRADLVQWVDNANVRTLLSNGDGTFDIRNQNTGGYGVSANDYRFELGDFNGDGLTDLAHFVSDAIMHIWLAKGDGTFDIKDGFRPYPTYGVSGNNYRYVLGDYNGDGKTDMMHFWSPDRTPLLWTSRGDGTFDVTEVPLPWTPYGLESPAGTYNFLPADVNGDGLTDLLHQIRGSVDYTFAWVSRGDGTFQVPVQVVTGADPTKPDQFQVGDFNGDGKTDLAYFFGDIAYKETLMFETMPIRVKTFLSTSPQTHRLNGITDAFKNESTISYQRLLSSPRYKKIPDGESSAYPTIFFASPFQVVSQVAHAKPQGGMNTTDYEYAGLKIQQGGMGLLGFRYINTITRTQQPYAQPQSIDNGDGRIFNGTEQNALITQTRYSQDWRQRSQGMAEESTTYRKTLVANSTLCITGDGCTGMIGAKRLSNTVTTFGHKFLNDPKRFFTFNASSQTQQWDLDGTLMSTTKTDNEMDDWGNTTQSITQVTDNQNADMSYKNIIINSFYPVDQNLWRFNLVSRQTDNRINLNQIPPYQPQDQTRTVAFEYDSRGRLSRKITEPDNAYMMSEETYSYNNQGLQIQSQVSVAGRTLRTSSNEFNANGSLASRTNGLGHRESYFYGDADLPWLPTSMTGPNGLVTQTRYDDLGRVQQQIGADKVSTSTRWYSCAEPEPNFPCGSDGDPEHSYTLQQTSGQKPTLTYYDRLGRVVRTQNYQFVNGADQLATQITRYNNEGLVSQISKPRYAAEALIYQTTSYDTLNRPIQNTDFKGNISRKSYSGFKTTSTDPLGHNYTEMKTALGQTLWTQDHNGQRMNYVYDAFGNLAQTTDPAGNTVKSQFDILGRKIYMKDPDQGAWSYQYDALGQLLKQTDAMQQQTVMSYDTLGRMTQRIDGAIRSGAGLSTSSYSLLQVSSGLCLQIRPNQLTNPIANLELGACSGDTHQQWRWQNNRLENPSGKCLAIEQVGYDGVINGSNLQAKTCSTANAQKWTLNSDSTVVSNNGQCLDAHVFDLSAVGGRVQSWACFTSVQPQQSWALTDPGQITRWTYDQGTQGKGKLSSESIGLIGATPQQTKTYRYDTLGRSQSTTTVINGGIGAGTYTTSTTYDNFSRPQTQSYPNNGPIIRHEYSARSGQHIATKHATTNQTYWRLNVQNAAGQTTNSVLGDNLQQRFTYDSNNRQTQRQTSLNGSNLQQWQVQYDSAGNVIQRKDVLTGMTENLSYDVINRMTNSAGSGVTANNLTYDSLGNILNKADLGTYTYGQLCNGIKAGPHAVSQISNPNGSSSRYCYDRNGNLTSKTQNNGFTQQVTYTRFNKPAQILRNDGRSTQLEYGSARELLRQTDNKNGVITTSVYLPGYERVQRGSSVTERFYIGDYAILTKYGNTTSIQYLLQDNQGTTTTIVDGNGNPLEQLGFDVWGQRRNSNGSPATQPEALASNFTNRGYTGHRQLDNVGLIHMNGRVYDPAIARFVSADPFIQSPGDLQSFNRYAYVRNNPASLVDPSGYGWLSKTWKKAWHNKYVRAAIAIAVTIYMPGALMHSFSFSAAQAGMAAGFISGGISTGTLKGAFIGAVTAGLLDKIGNAKTLTDTQRVLAHGMVGGTSSYASGGKFGAGFASMGLTQAASVSGWFETGMFAGKYGNAIGSALVGGTAAVAGGGDFAMGAYQGVMSRFLNDRAHPKMRLRRFDQSPDSTIGVLTLDGSSDSWYVLEPGGPDSMIEGSDRRIPEGEYQVKPYSSKKYPDVYEIENVPGRTRILIHPGNFHGNTEGCLLPGKSYGSDGAGNFRTFSSVTSKNQIFSNLNNGSSASIVITNDF